MRTCKLCGWREQTVFQHVHFPTCKTGRQNTNKPEKRIIWPGPNARAGSNSSPSCESNDHGEESVESCQATPREVLLCPTKMVTPRTWDRCACDRPLRPGSDLKFKPKCDRTSARVQGRAVWCFWLMTFHSWAILCHYFMLHRTSITYLYGPKMVLPEPFIFSLLLFSTVVRCSWSSRSSLFGAWGLRRGME